MKIIDNTTNTAVCIKPNPISNTILMKGMIGIANQPAKPFTKIAITDPLIMFPNKRKHKEIGSEISLIMFIGSITGFGSKKPFKYPRNPFEAIPAP